MELLRPVNGAMAVFGVVVGAALGGVSFMPPPLQLFLASLVAFLISGAGMTLNDYYDFRIDFMNRPNRPLPSGKVTMGSAITWATAMYVFAFVISVFTLKWTLLFMVILNTATTYAYAWWLKRTALGHFVVSWLVASTFIFGALLGDLTMGVIAVAGMAFTVNLSREMTKAVEDYGGDRANGAKTLVVALGLDVAKWLALAFVFAGKGFSVVPYVLGELGNGYLALIIPSDALAAWAGWKIFENAGHAQRLLKMAMLLALGAFALGLFF